MKFKIVFLTVFFSCTLSFAYIPPTHFLISNLIKKHNFSANTVFHHKIIVYNNNEEKAIFTEKLFVVEKTSQKTKFESYLFDANQKCVSHKSFSTENPPKLALFDLLLSNNEELSFLRLKSFGLNILTKKEFLNLKTTNKTDEQNTNTQETETTPQDENLKPDSSNPITKDNLNKFIQSKIPTNSAIENFTSLTRLGDKIAIMIGFSANPKENNTKLYLDKMTFDPIKYIEPSALNNEGIEFIFENYMMFSNYLFPKTIQVFKKNQLFLKIETIEILSNAKNINNNIEIHTPDSNIENAVNFYHTYLR